MTAPTVKFVVDVSGDSVDALLDAATKEANEFYSELPGKFRVKDISVSFDPEYYQSCVQAAVNEAQEKVDAWKAQHGDEEDFEDLEVVPASVPRYSGWIEFEYDINQSPGKKSINEVQADNKEADAERPVRPENDPKYQDAF